MKNNITYEGYKYSPESIKVYFNGLKIDDNLVKKNRLGYLFITNYDEAIKQTKKLVRKIFKQKNIIKYGLLLEDNQTAFTYCGCNCYSDSSIHDKYKLYKNLLELAKNNNYNYICSNVCTIGNNYKIESEKNNYIKITKKFVKIN